MSHFLPSEHFLQAFNTKLGHLELILSHLPWGKVGAFHEISRNLLFSWTCIVSGCWDWSMFKSSSHYFWLILLLLLKQNTEERIGNFCWKSSWNLSNGPVTYPGCISASCWPLGKEPAASRWPWREQKMDLLFSFNQGFFFISLWFGCGHKYYNKNEHTNYNRT